MALFIMIHTLRPPAFCQLGPHESSFHYAYPGFTDCVVAGLLDLCDMRGLERREGGDGGDGPMKLSGTGALGRVAAIGSAGGM